MPDTLWAAYAPDDKTPWNLARAVHLHRRAAFAGTWDELHRDVSDGPEKAVSRLLAGTANRHAAKEYETTARLLFDAAASQGEIDRLRAGWFYRFLFGPHPLLEKMTLLWHDHFATANSKVDDVGLMYRQNESLRQHALGRFDLLLNAAVREPTLLLYLDAPTNRKGHANENLGRELLELFTLGIGNYSEADVKEAARALTGWSVEDGQFANRPERHDAGEKAILGERGPFDGPQLVNLLLKRPATADRIVKKLVRQFFGEGGVPDAAAKELAAGLRERELDIAWAVETILKSRLIFSKPQISARACRVRWNTWSARPAHWSCSIRLRVRSPWPTGRRGWARTCSTRRTSAAGRAAGRGFIREA